MIHDVTGPAVGPPRSNGHARFGKITKSDADLLEDMGQHNNVSGKIFTVDGKAPHFPSASDPVGDDPNLPARPRQV
jgi:hypothetical protein